MRFAKRALQNNDLLDHVALTYVNALNMWRDTREEMEKDFVYAEGGSWAYNTDLRDELESKGFPTLKIPIIFPKLMRISGQEDEVRGRLTAIPTQDAGVIDADIATRLLDWNNVISERDEEVSQAFMHALIAKMGWLEVVWDNTDDPLGAPYVRHINPFFVIHDPAFPLYSVRKHRFVIKTFWASADEMIVNFPDSEQEIRAVTSPLFKSGVGGRAGIGFLLNSGNSQWQRLFGAGEELRNEFVNEKENTMRVIEMQERRKVREISVVNVTDGRAVMMPSVELAEQVVSQFSGLEIVDRTVDEIWTITTLADYVLLQEEKNEVQNGLFSIFPVGAYDFGGRNFSMVDQLTGVQEEYERGRSSMLHILHTTAASGWQYPEGSLDPDMEERLENEGAAAGLILKWKPTTGGKPEKIQPNGVPVGEMNRAQMALNDADMISSVGPGELGQPEGGKESGILHAQRVKEAVTTFRPLFRNLNRTMKLIGRYLIDLMAVKIKPGRVIRIVGEENQVDKITVGNQLQIGRYEIKIAKGAESETQRLQRQVEAEIAVSRMPPELVPWDLYFQDVVDWPNKQEWVDRIRQNLGIPPARQQQLAAQIAQLQAGLQNGVAPVQPAAIGATRVPEMVGQV